MLHRITQFIWALTSSFKKVDYKFVSRYLTDGEKHLFNNMKKSDMQHCIRVAKNIEYSLGNKEYNIKYDDQKINELIRLGLLHDIGKSECKLNCIEKSIMVILNKLTKSKIKKLTKFKIVRNYYNHADRGADLLSQLNNQYTDQFIEAIKNHHNKGALKNEELLILKRADDIS